MSASAVARVPAVTSIVSHLSSRLSSGLLFLPVGCLHNHMTGNAARHKRNLEFPKYYNKMEHPV